MLSSFRINFYILFILQRRMREAALVLGSGTCLFVAYCTAVGDEKFYANHLMPTLQRFLDPEMAHILAVRFISWGLIPRSKCKDSSALVSAPGNHETAICAICEACLLDLLITDC